jgi:predicted small secreted protein
MSGGIKKTDEAGMTRIFSALALVAALAGCNTVDGIGRDISSGAQTVQRTF